MNFSPAEISEFQRRGILKLDGVLPTEVACTVREKIYSILNEAGVTESGRWTADKVLTSQAFTRQMQLHKQLKRCCKTELVRFEQGQIAEVAEQLADKQLSSLGQSPQLLFTPPNADRWQLPSKVWHVDIPRLGEQSCPGIQLFSFVDEVVPEGGGTIVAAGSHRYVNNQGTVKSKDVKKALRKAHPWFRGLFSSKGADKATYMDRVTRDGDVELQAVELTGSPGDVYLMDLRLFHTLAPNVTDRPRLMVTQRYYSEQLVEVFH